MPRVPLPGIGKNCHCEYPNESLLPNSVIDSLIILPGDSIYCIDVIFICDHRDAPANAVEWTCPNLNPIIHPVTSSKGESKNTPIIVGNPINAIGGSIIIGTGSKSK